MNIGRGCDKVDDKTGERKVTGWKPEIAAEILQAACAHAGLFDPQGKERGRGAWRGPQGELIIHHGDKIYTLGIRARPRLGRSRSDRRLCLSDRAGDAAAGSGHVDDSAGVALLGLLRSWYWERPKIDPYLLLGFIAAAPFGGALDWRPHVWTTGDSATGKSTLEKKLLAPLFEGLSFAPTTRPRRRSARCSASRRCRYSSTSSRPRPTTIARSG
jgi:hypothetical protein